MNESTGEDKTVDQLDEAPKSSPMNESIGGGKPVDQPAQTPKPSPASRSITALLLEERAPFVLAALLAFVSWTVTHVVDTILKAPIVKYEQINEDGQVHFDLTNISDTLFKDLQISVLLRRGIATEVETNVMPHLPMIVDKLKEPLVSSDSVIFTIAELHPGWRIRLTLRVQPETVLGIGFKGHDAALRLEPGSLATRLVENETPVLIALASGAIVLIGWYLALLARG